MFGYAISVLIAGPLTDTFGNRRVLVINLIIYLIATFCAMISNSISSLIIARFFQALGGCSGTLIARVMIKNYYKREDQMAVLTHLSSIMAICPVFFPLLGGVLETYFGWRIVFNLLGLFALILLFLFITQIKDSPDKSHPFSLKELLSHYGYLLTHRQFLTYSFAIGCAWGSYFAFTMESPFLFQKALGYHSIAYGAFVAMIVVGYMIGTQLTRRYANQLSWDKLIHMATYCCLAGSLLMVLFVSLIPLNWFIIILPMMIIMAGVGIIIPCTQGAVMQPFPTITGTASGLFYFIQMLFGGLSGLILQSIHHESALPMAIVILLFSTFLFVTFNQYKVNLGYAENYSG